MNYSEPKDWYYPPRQALGAVLLAAGQAPQAECVYREDLLQHPENGWSLFGLAQSLRLQQKMSEAANADGRFLAAWKLADSTPQSSDF